MGQGMMRRAAKEIDDKLDHFALSLDCTPTPSNATTDNTSILDSGCTSNFLSAAAPCSDKKSAHVPLNSLISVWQLCDNECSVTFTQDHVTVSKNRKNVMYSSWDPKSRLWRVNLKQKSITKHVQCNHAHDNNNQKDLINYLHAACFSPVKSTWITAIKNGNFSFWPGLTEHAVEKNMSKSASCTIPGR
jgi:hypothetical protein